MHLKTKKELEFLFKKCAVLPVANCYVSVCRTSDHYPLECWSHCSCSAGTGDSTELLVLSPLADVGICDFYMYLMLPTKKCNQNYVIN